MAINLDTTGGAVVDLLASMPALTPIATAVRSDGGLALSNDAIAATLGRSADTLSSGEQRIVELARDLWYENGPVGNLSRLDTPSRLAAIFAIARCAGLHPSLIMAAGHPAAITIHDGR